MEQKRKELDLKLKICGMCKTPIPKNHRGWTCEECTRKRQKEYRENCRSKATKVYDSKRWKDTRHSVRKENPYCEYCLEIGQRTLATEVHHIIKVSSGDDSTHYDKNNLLSLCHKHHRLVENMTKEQIIESILKDKQNLK